MIEVDPKIEQTFAEVLARSRHRAADITERLVAQQRAMEERSKQIVEEGRQLSEEMDRRVAEKETAQANPWQTRESKPTVLAFGDDDEGGPKPVPPQPAVTPPPAAAYPSPPVPEPEPAPPAPEPSQRFLSFDVEDEDTEQRRPAPPQSTRPAAQSEDEDDDYSGRSWVR